MLLCWILRNHHNIFSTSPAEHSRIAIIWDGREWWAAMATDPASLQLKSSSNVSHGDSSLTINVLAPSPDWRVWGRPKPLGVPWMTFLVGSFKGEGCRFLVSLYDRPLGEWERPSERLGWYWLFKDSKSTTGVCLSGSGIFLFLGKWSTCREREWGAKYFYGRQSSIYVKEQRLENSDRYF